MRSIQSSPPASGGAAVFVLERTERPERDPETMASPSAPKTLYDKIFDEHIVDQQPDGTCVL